MAKKENKGIFNKMQDAFTKNEESVDQTLTVENTEVEKTKPVVKQPKVKTPAVETPKTKKNTWEIKDRMYYLKGNMSPLTYSVRASNVFYFDEELGYERELKYTSNQRTPFVDEMKGDQRLEHIVFENGSLFVPRNKTVLQKLLSLYHPHNGSLFLERLPEREAASEVENIEVEIEALNAAQSLDIDMAEAVMRVEIGSKVTKMSSKELKRDLLLYAKRNPELFLDLVNDDNVMLRNFGIKATEMGILKLSSDQRTFTWGSNDRKLMNVPFDEHPYSALASWFKTDEGMEIYSNIEKRLN